MKSIKHILILAVLVLLGNSIMAQQSELTEEQRARMQAQLTEYSLKLDLSEAQKPKFEDITRKYGKQMMSLKESNKGRLAKYKEFKTIRKNKDAEMKAILSEEQFEAYLETQEEMQRKMKEKKGGATTQQNWREKRRGRDEKEKERKKKRKEKKKGLFF